MLIFCDTLLSNKEEEALVLLENETYTPLLIKKELHNEQEPDLEEYNNMLYAIGHDINILKSEIGFSAGEIRSLMSNTKNKLEYILTFLKMQKIWMIYLTLKNLRGTQLLIVTEKESTVLDSILKMKRPFLLLLLPEIKYTDDSPENFKEKI